jgi:hypothetical protein
VNKWESCYAVLPTRDRSAAAVKALQAQPSVSQFNDSQMSEQVGIRTLCLMPVYRVGAARHPEQGENEEAVSDSVNTVASLTGFTLRTSQALR